MNISEQRKLFESWFDSFDKNMVQSDFAKENMFLAWKAAKESNPSIKIPYPENENVSDYYSEVSASIYNEALRDCTEAIEKAGYSVERG